MPSALQNIFQYSNIFDGHRASSEKNSPVEKFQIFLLGYFFLKMPCAQQKYLELKKLGYFFLKMPCALQTYLNSRKIFWDIDKDAHGHFSKDAQFFQSKEGILQEDYLLTL